MSKENPERRKKSPSRRTRLVGAGLILAGVSVGILGLHGPDQPMTGGIWQDYVAFLPYGFAGLAGLAMTALGAATIAHGYGWINLAPAQQRYRELQGIPGTH